MPLGLNSYSNLDEAARSNISGEIIIVNQQGGDAMLPSYSVRRGRLTAQLPCRTGTSYTPEESDSQYTLILKNHLGVSHTLAIGSWHCSNESNNSQQQALVFESCITRTQHLATKQATTSAQIQSKLVLILSKTSHF